MQARECLPRGAWIAGMPSREAETWQLGDANARVTRQPAAPAHPDPTTSGQEGPLPADARLPDRRYVGWPGKNAVRVAGGAYRLLPGARAVRRLSGSRL